MFGALFKINVMGKASDIESRVSKLKMRFR